MDDERRFIPRREVSPLGNVHVPVTVMNGLDLARSLTFEALVDTGAFALTLPRAWQSALGPLRDVEDVELETADQRVVVGVIRGPVRIAIPGFRPFNGDVLFMDMEPRPDGKYEPLLGYTVLELCGAVVDMVRHRLIRRRHYYAKVVAA